MKLTIVCDCPGTRRDGISIIESLGYGISKIYTTIPAAYVSDHHGLISEMTKKYSSNPTTRNHRKMNAIFDILLRLKKELSANDVESKARLNNLSLIHI